MTVGLTTTPGAESLEEAGLARGTKDSGRLGPRALRLVAILFGISLALSLALFIVRPINNGHEYQLGVRLIVLLSLIWGVSTFRARWLGQRWFLGLVFAVGVYCAVSRPLTIKKDSEIVAAYTSAFAALDAGKNPYDSGTIVHFAEHGAHELGNFNYPPVELIPYYAVAKLVGHWDHRVLTATLLLLQVSACALLASTFRGARGVVLAFAPLLICFELYTNGALTLLAVALAMYLIHRPAESGRARSEKLLALVFGVSLLTKFMIIPLFAAYVVQRLPVRPWRAWRACVPPLVDAATAVLVAFALMLPFGPIRVLRETLVFNLMLGERARLTTFYPNVLSGTLTWLDMPDAFPVLAVLLLGAAILWSRRLPLMQALLFSGAVFLLVSPTPELQYIPVMVYLALCAALQAEPPQRDSTGAPTPSLLGPDAYRMPS